MFDLLTEGLIGNIDSETSFGFEYREYFFLRKEVIPFSGSALFYVHALREEMQDDITSDC
jgi:hypothetical protein